MNPAQHPLAEYFQEKDISPNNPEYVSLDTLLEGVQKYFPDNFPYSLGLANRKLFFEPASSIGFTSGIDYPDLFGYNKDAIKYYRTRTPYTEVFVLFGMKKEQFSRLLHTQNITKQWNIALRMLRIRSEGFYQRQLCTDNNISLSSNYTSKNNRYSLLANGIISSVKTDENGGIRDDDSFESNLLVNKKLIPVNLLDARTKRRYREVYIKQSLHILPTHSFSYSFNAQDNLFAYSENSPGSGYYENIFFDSVKTLDSTYISALKHGISWENTFLKKVVFGVSFKNNVSHIVQYKADSMLAEDTLIQDNILYGGIGKKIPDKDTKGFYWNLDGKYIINGNNEGDYYINCRLNPVFRNDKKIFFELIHHLRSAPFIYSRYASNHFKWEKSFNKTSEIRASLNYMDSKNKFFMSAEMNQLTGYVYFDSVFASRQFDSALIIYSAFLQKNFHLKHFCFNNKITWQKASEDIIHLPQFVTNHSLYYQGKWFQKATEVQLGFDVSFFTSYYADAYMPALGQYYWQNEKGLGNYPFVDFFFTMKVKHTKIFLKTEHLNSGLMGAYYLAPHHPAPDRSIKAGINWMFFD